MLWLGEVASLICNFYLSVVAHARAWEDRSLRYKGMFLGLWTSNHQQRWLLCIWSTPVRTATASKQCDIRVHWWPPNQTQPSRPTSSASRPTTLKDIAKLRDLHLPCSTRRQTSWGNLHYEITTTTTTNKQQTKRNLLSLLKCYPRPYPHSPPPVNQGLWAMGPYLN